MSSTRTERPAYDSKQGNAADQLGQIIDAVDAARAAAEAAKPKVWHFASTADARAAVDQDHVNDGDVLVVDSERVVGFVSVVYPVAITEEHGAFHAYSALGKPAREYSAGAYTASVELAEQAAVQLGATLADPVAAQAVRIADGKPAPIEIPRLLVEPGDILHGFGARLRVIDTGTRISGKGEGEWWALVHGATEDDSRRTYRGSWGFAVPVAAAAWDVVTVERILPPPGKATTDQEGDAQGRREDAVDRALLLDDLELDLTGGCSACGLEPDWMCVACGRCNCDRHDNCKRPTGQ